MQHNTNDFSPPTLMTSDENAEFLCENDTNLPSISVQSTENVLWVRPPVMSRFIDSVRFISTSEMKFVDKQREKYPLMKWFAEDKQKQAKPSRHWFSKNHQWLRAVCTENRYGLLCIDCAEFATNKSLIERNDGAFVVTYVLIGS